MLFFGVCFFLYFIKLSAGKGVKHCLLSMNVRFNYIRRSKKRQYPKMADKPGVREAATCIH